MPLPQVEEFGNFSLADTEMLYIWGGGRSGRMGIGCACVREACVTRARDACLPARSVLAWHRAGAQGSGLTLWHLRWLNGEKPSFWAFWMSYNVLYVNLGTFYTGAYNNYTVYIKDMHPHWCDVDHGPLLGPAARPMID